MIQITIQFGGTFVSWIKNLDDAEWYFNYLCDEENGYWVTEMSYKDWKKVFRSWRWKSSIVDFWLDLQEQEFDSNLDLFESVQKNTQKRLDFLTEQGILSKGQLFNIFWNSLPDFKSLEKDNLKQFTNNLTKALDLNDSTVWTSISFIKEDNWKVFEKITYQYFTQDMWEGIGEKYVKTTYGRNETKKVYTSFTDLIKDLNISKTVDLTNILEADSLITKSNQNINQMTSVINENDIEKITEKVKHIFENTTKEI